MKTIVGVMGPSAIKTDEAELSREIGKVVADSGAVLLTGGMGGVMEEASRGAKEAGGEVMAICPTFDKSDVNPYVDIPVMTGMRSGRNFANILTSDVVIAIGSVSAGTLSEIAFALQLERPLMIINASEAMQRYLEEYESPTLSFVDTIEEITEKLAELKINKK